MNNNERAKKLSEHLNVPRGNMTLVEWFGAIKKAAKQPNTSIEELYDHTFNKGGAKKDDKPVPAKIEDAKTVEAVAVRPIRDTHGSAAAPLMQKFDVAAPTIQVHVPPAVVHAQSVRDLRAAELAIRFLTHCFVFGSGAMAGVLWVLRRQIMGG